MKAGRALGVRVGRALGIRVGRALDCLEDHRATPRQVVDRTAGYLARHRATSILVHLVFAAALLVPFGWWVWHIRHEGESFDQQCRADGGHIRLERSSTAQVGPKGEPMVDYRTTHYCLDHHGKVLRTHGS